MKAPQVVEGTPERRTPPDKGVAPERLQLDERELSEHVARSREILAKLRERLTSRTKPNGTG